MNTQAPVSFRQHTRPHDVDAALQQQLTRCWIEVGDAGGAAGFPFPPVDPDEVAAATAGIVAARGGVGPEDFYGRLGWRETGRWPGALRTAPETTGTRSSCSWHRCDTNAPSPVEGEQRSGTNRT
ncbi:hypothetical protein [Streptomyces thermolineatus]|uniref:hypothetical protein n=1 Tax=Streptomyces thermolineatus TaxID=44033 RepID=UPI00384D076A